MCSVFVRVVVHWDSKREYPLIAVQRVLFVECMSPVSPVFQTEVTVSIGLKNIGDLNDLATNSAHKSDYKKWTIQVISHTT